MIRITKPERPSPNLLSLRQEMILIIHSTNKFLTEEVMKNYDFMKLLREITPLYRRQYAEKLKNNQIITQKEFQNIELSWTKKNY